MIHHPNITPFVNVPIPPHDLEIAQILPDRSAGPDIAENIH